MTALCRGDIHLVNFDPARGGEIGKLRPAVILSDTLDNEVLDTVVVIPLSSVIEKDTFPYRRFLEKRESLDKDSDACIYEIRALSKTRIKNRVARLREKELEDIQTAICSLFG